MCIVLFCDVPCCVRVVDGTLAGYGAGAECDVAASLPSVSSCCAPFCVQVRWQPPIRDAAGVPRQHMCVVSASMDRSMLVWQPDETGVWVPVVRLGEVGGNTLGFFGGIMSRTGDRLLAHGYHGSVHQWKHQVDVDVDAAVDAGAGAGAGADAHPGVGTETPATSAGAGVGAGASASDGSVGAGAGVTAMDEGRWMPLPSTAGHFGPVMDACWGTAGDYIVSVSTDQTCRLHGDWHADRADAAEVGWRELARPQVGGRVVGVA